MIIFRIGLRIGVRIPGSLGLGGGIAAPNRRYATWADRTWRIEFSGPHTPWAA